MHITPNHNGGISPSIILNGAPNVNGDVSSH